MNSRAMMPGKLSMDRRAYGFARLTSLAASGFALVGGMLALAGWVLNIRRLTDWNNAGISIFINAAFCAMAGGLASTLLVEARSRRRNFFVHCAGWFLIAIAGLTLVEHCFSVNLGIDTLLLYRQWGQGAATAPMRMGPPASISFLAIGIVLLLATFGSRSREIASYLVLVPLGIASLSLVGYWFGADELFGIARFTGIALPTSAIIAALGIAVIAAIPEHGVAAALGRHDAGGTVLRRLILPVVLLPLLLGWLRTLGEAAGLYDAAFGTALRSLVESLLFFGLLWWTSVSISQHAKAAREAKGKLAAIVESSDDAIVSKSLDGIIQSWNAGAERLFGYRQQEAIGRHISLIIPPERIDEEGKILDCLRRGESIEHFETIRVRKDGTKLNISLTVSPIRDETGAVIGASKIARNITERTKAHEALREQTRALEVLNKTGAAIGSTLDLQKLLQAVTESATELSGAQFGAFFYNTTDDKGDSYLLYTLSGAPREAFDKFGQPRATPLFAPTFKGEGTIRADDILTDSRYGQWDPHHGMPRGHLPVRSYLAVPVISRSGEVIGGLFFGHSETGVFTEKTEGLISGIASQAAVAIDNARLYEGLKRADSERSRLLEAERAARTVAEQANVVKDEFLATLSHELRTPLTAILGWSQLLTLGGLSEADAREGSEAIQRNARIQTQLIDDLLDMSRITAGKVRLDVQQVDLAATVNTAIESARPTADAKQIELRRIIDPHAGPVSGDPTRLHQIVWNLLSNAIKFTPRDGKVEVVLARVNSHVEITVKDSGIGIKPDFLPIVFDRFRQADASTTRAYGGLGLGLSIVKNLVELHGGTVHAESAGEGQGAIFVVKLPIAPIRTGENREHPTYHKAPESEFDPMLLAGLKVLVVDDEADTRELIKRVLSQSHALVTTAGSAVEGLSMLRTHKPDVIVSDLGMPDKDGYQFIRAVRALSPADGGKTPAVALTAYARSEDRTQAMIAGYQVHIAKPIEPKELIATVKSVAGHFGPL